MAAQEARQSTGLAPPAASQLPPTTTTTSTPTNPTLRIGQLIRLKPEHTTAYIELHSSVWPSVLSRINACHIHDYSIFHDAATGLLFASFKYTGSDWEGDMRAMAEDEEVRRWWKVTDGMQESLNEGAQGSVEGGWWRVLEEVFYTA